MARSRTISWCAATLAASTAWGAVAGAAPAASAEQSAPAAAPAKPADATTAPAENACFPPCRSGFLCYQARCVSMCNPPCGGGEVCVDGTRCEREVRTPEVVEPPPPLAPRGFADRDATGLAFHLGFGGSVERSHASRDLDTTLGFNVRGDVPVFRYLVIGPILNFGAWRPDVRGTSPDYNYAVDLDLYVRGRLPIELDKLGLSFWAGIPIGLTLDFLGNTEGAALDSFGVGWNVGALVGAAVHFSNRFGMFTELGWMQHKMSHGSGSGSTAFRLSQGVWNIGFLFAD